VLVPDTKVVERFIGRCIYCPSAEELTDEHVIPRALNGNLILRAASCKRCATITSAFELKVLRDTLGPARAMMKLRTRRKKDRPKTLPMRMESEGKETIEQVPVEDYVGVLPILERELPQYLGHVPHALGRRPDYVGLSAKMILRRDGEHLDLARRALTLISTSTLRMSEGWSLK
jgi:hypothetical protein